MLLLVADQQTYYFIDQRENTVKLFLITIAKIIELWWTKMCAELLSNMWIDLLELIILVVMQILKHTKDLQPSAWSNVLRVLQIKLPLIQNLTKVEFACVPILVLLLVNLRSGIRAKGSSNDKIIWQHNIKVSLQHKLDI